MRKPPCISSWPPDGSTTRLARVGRTPPHRSHGRSSRVGAHTFALQTQQLVRVAVRDALPVRLADREVLQERTRLRHRPIRMVNREHDPFNADLKQQVEERRCKIEAAEGVVNVLAQIGAEGRSSFVTSLGRFLLSLGSMNGMPSPKWPMMTCSFG